MTLFMVRGPLYVAVSAYQTKVPGRFHVPRSPVGSCFVTLGEDAFESQADARHLAEKNHAAGMPDPRSTAPLA